MKLRELLVENNLSKKFVVDPSFEKFYDEDDDLEYRRLVNVNTAKLNNAWSHSNLYIGSGGTNQIKTRYQQFGQWINSTNEPIIASTVGVDHNGSVSFYNGRHRFAWLRDNGMKAIPVAMDSNSIRNAKKYGYV
jgi:hypothetical protein